MASTSYRSKPRTFLPGDPRVEEPYRLTPQLAFRIGILGAFALAAFALLFLRLWALQVLSGEDYLRAARDNQLRQVRVEAARGQIVDRKGRAARRQPHGHVDPHLAVEPAGQGPLRRDDAPGPRARRAALGRARRSSSSRSSTR